jgi:hypothetical protein
VEFGHKKRARLLRVPLAESAVVSLRAGGS